MTKQPSIFETPQAVDVPVLLMELQAWEPYRPDGYPIADRFHNPFVTLDPISGKNAYNVWCDMGRTDDADKLRAALDALTATRGNDGQDEPNADYSRSLLPQPIDGYGVFKRGNLPGERGPSRSTTGGARALPDDGA